MVSCVLNGFDGKKYLEKAGISIEDFKAFMKFKLEEQKNILERARVNETIMKMVTGDSDSLKAEMEKSRKVDVPFFNTEEVFEVSNDAKRNVTKVDILGGENYQG